MQALTAELEAILKSKFQAGASGFRAVIEVDGIPTGEAIEGEAYLYAYTSPSTTKVWRASYGGGTLGGTPTGWDAPGFDDSGWAVPADVSTIPYAGRQFEVLYGAHPPSAYVCPIEVIPVANGGQNTQGGGLIWLSRTEFILNALPTESQLEAYVDDGASYSINGTAVSPGSISVDGFVIGTNVLAVETTNSGDGRGWDMNPTCLRCELFTNVLGAGYTPTVYRPTRISIDKSLRMTSDQATVELQNEALPLGSGLQSAFPKGARIRIYQWYGDEVP